MGDRKISHFRILGKIGSGGMGEVYEAEDINLGRRVALKLIAEHYAGDPDAAERLRREARAVSALNHPNICTLYEIAEADGQQFLAMELLDGHTLRHHLNGKPLSNETFLSYAAQIADALDAAHSRGVIHRDLKPENIFITTRDQAKVLDFGIATITCPARVAEKVAASVVATACPPTLGFATTPGSAMGTISYMSPEQARGEPCDARSDLFSFGTVLYEMATGQRPFTGDNSTVTVDAILHHTPASVRSLNPQIPVQVERLIFKVLQKDPTKRSASAAEMRIVFDGLRQKQIGDTDGRFAFAQVLRKPSFVAISLVALAVVITAGALGYRRYSRHEWLRDKAIPEITQLALERKGIAAFRILKEAERFGKNDPALAKVKAATLWPNTILSTPAGADVYVRDYADTAGAWEYLGKTPLKGARLPHAFYTFKLLKEGYDPVMATGTALEHKPLNVVLDAAGSLPPGMVHVPAGKVDPTHHFAVALDDFLIDKFEITNRDYKKFVDAGGYRNPQYWNAPVVKDDHRLDFNEAMLLFRDKTNRYGPSTWELGSYPAGEDDYPVTGVSWYEAAAFAEYSGKSLPSVYHWYRAADMGRFSDILQASNFYGKGAAPVGKYSSLGPFGTYDMAGNVKEWCLNDSPAHTKYILGGASTDPPYMYQQAEARTPLDRSGVNGIRLVKYLHPATVSGPVTAPLSFATLDRRDFKPVSDEVFRIYQGLFSYDQTPLDAKLESEDDSSPYFRRQRVTFNAAYGGERVIAYLFLPKNVAAPYQTVVYFPHAGAHTFRTVEDSQILLIDFLVKSGRALMFPIYKDTYERLGNPPAPGTVVERDEAIQQIKDLRRSVDYLETRSDIDTHRLAYYGISWGGDMGSLATALEPRFKAAVFAAGGCDNDKVLPEIDPMNFAPRARLPILMVNGRYDFMNPAETCQRPLFQLLGSAPQDKRYVLFDTGHSPPQLPVMKEALDWLDHYLGPVR